MSQTCLQILNIETSFSYLSQPNINLIRIKHIKAIYNVGFVQ